jgi:hypothetical protein
MNKGEGMKTNFLTRILSVVLGLTLSSTAQAGLLDKINSAAQKLNEKAQQMETKQNTNQPKEDPDHPLRLEAKNGSCEGHRSATCMDYGEAVDQCMDPVRGYRMKVLGDKIERKLKEEQLSDKERKSLQEDLTAAKEAYKNKTDNPTIAGQKDSQRYLSDISDEDQIWVNAEYGQFRNKIYNKCMGADHMQTGHRTELITDFGPSGDEAVAEYRKEHPRRRNSASNDCLKMVGGVRYKVMADMMEKKMKTLKLSDKEKGEWQADIAAVRKTADAGGTTMPQVDDPANPYRPMTRLSSPDDMMAVNNEYMQASQKAMNECNAQAKK